MEALGFKIFGFLLLFSLVWLVAKRQPKTKKSTTAINKEPKHLESIYRNCKLCGQPISKRRLAVAPDATLCVPCKTDLERGETGFPAEEISEETEADYELVSEIMDEVIPKATEKHLDDYEQKSEITEDKKPVETYQIEEIQKISRFITGYKHQRLCFYSSVIEPLHDEDLFQVETYNHGTFRFTKAQFHQHFPNVVKSVSYKEHGMYHYPTIPGKALPFKIKKLE
jgi:hypothetical protein